MAATILKMNEKGGIIEREQVEAAIVKAVKLRAIHAALMQGRNNSPPAHLNFLSSPPPLLPLSQHTPHLSSHDYPVFTPSYEDEPLPGYVHLQTATQSICESWDESRIGGEHQNNLYDQPLQLSSYTGRNVPSRKGLPPGLANMKNHVSHGDDTKSVASSYTNQMSFLQNSPGGADFFKSRRRNSLGDLNSVSSCNNCKPAIISTDNNENTSIKHSTNMIVPLTDSHAAMNPNPSQTKSRGMRFSWRLFPRLKTRQKNEISSPVRTETEELSQFLKNFSGVPIEMLKKELVVANQKKDAALNEVSEMRSSFGELNKKLGTLESYCEELKKALRQTSQIRSISKRGKLIDGKNNGEDLMPVSEEVMVEGFLQIVSEARLSVKQFCKTLYEQIDETDELLTQNLNLLLKPYKLSLRSRYTEALFYHLEAIINQTLYQDFENCAFQKNGTPKLLDPQEHRLAQFQSFVGLRNLSWNEVLKKGTKYYSDDFSKFCDQKMSCIIMTLNWTRPWSETLLQSFFVAAKCIWLLHLLAFSFYPPLTILRVDENIAYDSHYMEDIFTDKQKAQNSSKVKVMIMPGFYVRDKILRCKVLCRYKSVS